MTLSSASVAMSGGSIAIHTWQPGSSVVSTAGTTQLAAQEYLGRYRDLVGVKAAELQKLSFPPESGPIDAGVEYRFFAEKLQFDATTGIASHIRR